MLYQIRMEKQQKFTKILTKHFENSSNNLSQVREACYAQR